MPDIGYTGPGVLPNYLEESKGGTPAKNARTAGRSSQLATLKKGGETTRNVNQLALPAVIAGTGGEGNIFSSSAKAKSSPTDPLLSQLKFFQLIAPFLQQTIRDAVGGMNSAADNYDQQVGGAVDDLDPSLQGYFQNIVPQVSGAIRNQGEAQAQSATAQPQWDFLMSLVQGYRQQQEEKLQMQQMINSLQSQLSAAPADAGNGLGVPSDLVGLLTPKKK